MKYKTLQCGFQKSGNYLLWRIIKFCQEKKNVFSSFVEKSGLSQTFKLLYDIKELPEKFENYFIIDETDIEAGGLVIEKDYPNEYRKVKVRVNEILLINTTSILWTHSLPEKVARIAPYFPYRFYLLRDGRDVVNSYIHFNCSPLMRKINPDYRIDNPVALYSKVNIFKKYVELWKNHIESYYKVKDFFIEVRYEDLAKFEGDFLKIIKLFSCEEFVNEARENLDFSKLSKKNKNHLRKGKNGDWKNYFSEVHKEIFKEIAGETLIKLGYEKDMNW